MKWASSTCPQTIKLVVKKLPEREEQRFHKNPFAVIRIVEVLRSCFHFFGCFLNLILWHCSVAGGSSPYSLLSFQCQRKTSFISLILPKTHRLPWSFFYSLSVGLSDSHKFSIYSEWPEKKEESLREDYKVCPDAYFPYLFQPYLNKDILWWRKNTCRALKSSGMFSKFKKRVCTRMKIDFRFR